MNIIEIFKESVLFIFAIPIAIFGGIKICDDVFGSGNFSKKLATLFKSIKIQKKVKSLYYEAFFLTDSIFGQKILSWKSFIISTFITFLWVCSQVVLSYFYNKNGVYFDIIFRDLRLLKIFFLLLVVCIFIDYASLCITRFIIGITINKCKNITFLILILFVDLILSSAWFFISYNTAIYLIAIKDFSSLKQFIDSLNLEIIIDWISNPLQVHSQMVALSNVYATPAGNGAFEITGGNFNILYAFPNGILYISSLFTSIWIWAIILSVIVLNFSIKIDSIKDCLIKESSIDSKPYLSIALIVTILVFIPLFLLYFLYRLVF